MEKKNISSFIALMSIFLFGMGNSIVTAALQNIAEAFPHIKYSTILLVSALPMLTIIPFTMLSGAVAGLKVKYRTLLITGYIIYVVAGTAPYFIHDFTLVLVARALFGAGLGILTPLGPALILRLYEGQARASVLGYSSIVTNIGGIILQLVGATLCAISWRNTFLAHLLGMISLTIILFALKEPEKVIKSAGQKIKLPVKAYVIFFMFGLFALLANPVLMNMSTIIITSNMGNAAAVGLILAMTTVGGMFSGAIFGKLYSKTSRYIIAIALLTTASGLVFVNFANNMLLLTAGAVVLGAGFGIMMPSITMIIGSIVVPAATSFAIGVMMAFMNIFGFSSTYYIELLARLTGNPSPKLPLYIAMVVFTLAGAIYALISFRMVPAPSAVKDGLA